MKKLLQVKNLSVKFFSEEGEIEAVRGVDFFISKGERVALVGESGCGKSAAAKALLGLSSGAIHADSIEFEGEELTGLSKNKRRSIRGRQIGMIFQDPMTSLNPTMRVGLQIMEATVRLPARERALELLKQVGIDSPERVFRQYPHELSGGMRQRILIAMAIAGEPSLLIADEPTTALDVTIQAEILELLKRIEITTLLITHDLGVVAGLCDRVLVMYGGKIVEMGLVEQIFHEPGHPYTRALLRSIPRIDLRRDLPLEVIEGYPPSLLSPPAGCPFAARCSEAMQICALKEPPLTSFHSTQEVTCWLSEKP